MIDARYTVEDISESSGSIYSGTVFQISARLVPHLLRLNEKGRRMKIAAKLLLL